MDLHPDCEQLAFLLGTWRGGGEGDYPTIDAFAYNEEVVFGHVGKPFLSYSQKTRHAESGLPLHAEAGYLRAVGGAAIELVLAQPSGIMEIHTGTVDGTALSLTLHQVSTTPAALSVTDVTRAIRLDGEALVYDIAMAAVGEPLTHHLTGRLERA